MDVVLKGTGAHLNTPPGRAEYIQHQVRTQLGNIFSQWPRAGWHLETEFQTSFRAGIESPPSVPTTIARNVSATEAEFLVAALTADLESERELSLETAPPTTVGVPPPMPPLSSHHPFSHHRGADKTAVKELPSLTVVDLPAGTAPGEGKISLAEVTASAATCTICMEEFKVGDVVTKLQSCKACYFHLGGSAVGQEDCGGIITWLKDEHTCPNCRQEVPMDTAGPGWTCFGCDQQNKVTAERCRHCGVGHNVGGRWRQDEHFFNSVAALAIRARRGEDIASQADALLRSEDLHRLEEGNWRVRNGITSLFDLARRTASESGAAAVRSHGWSPSADTVFRNAEDLNTRALLGGVLKLLRDSSESDIAALLQRVASGPAMTQLGTMSIDQLRAKCAELAGRNANVFLDTVSRLISQGGTDQEWSAAKEEIAEFEGRGWRVSQAVGLLQAEVRELGLLIEGVDERSRFLVELLLRLVEQQSRSRRDTSLPQTPAATSSAVSLGSPVQPATAFPQNSAQTHETRAAGGGGGSSGGGGRGSVGNEAARLAGAADPTGGVDAAAPTSTLRRDLNRTLAGLRQDTEGDPVKILDCIRVLETVVKNLRDHPDMDKYCRVKKGSTYVFTFPRAKRFLEMLGFLENQYYLQLGGIPEQARLAVAYDCLENAKMYA